MAEKPEPKAIPPTLAEVMAESARLKRQSAAILKRLAELDEKIARVFPGAPPKRKRSS